MAPFCAVPGGEAGGRGPAAQSLLSPPHSGRGRGLRGAPKANVHCGGDGLQKKKKKGKNRLWKVGCGGSQLGVVLLPVLPGDTGQCLKTFSVLTPGCYWHLGVEDRAVTNRLQCTGQRPRYAERPGHPRHPLPKALVSRARAGAPAAPPLAGTADVTHTPMAVTPGGSRQRRR